MTLTQAIVLAILTWSPAREHNQPQIQGSLAESAEAYEARVASIASDIVEVAAGPDEGPLFENDPHAYKTSILVAAVGFWETKFFKYTRGYCNDYEWRKTSEGRRQLLSGDCDGGLAFTYWQVHPMEGIVLQDGGWQRAFNFSPEWRAGHSGEIIGGVEMLNDDKTAVRVVLHMLRQSLKRTGGLTGYTGEANSNLKARARLNFARNYWTAHPWTPAVDSDE